MNRAPGSAPAAEGGLPTERTYKSGIEELYARFDEVEMEAMEGHRHFEDLLDWIRTTPASTIELDALALALKGFSEASRRRRIYAFMDMVGSSGPRASWLDSAIKHLSDCSASAPAESDASLSEVDAETAEGDPPSSWSIRSEPHLLI